MQELDRTYDYYKQVFQGREMPFAFVDLDLLDANLKAIIQRSRNKQIRVASKSVRSVALLNYILTQNPKFIGVMCFSAQEALYLSEQGINDLLLGYPIWHQHQIQEICEANKRGKRITLMVDCEAHIEHIAQIATSVKAVVPLCIDVDMSVDFGPIHFGVWRSPVTHPDQALRLLRLIEGYPSLRLDGVMGYEAQIAGLGDRIPGQRVKNQIIRILKRRSRKVVALRREAIVEALNHHGARLRFVNGGGTGSVESTRLEDCVTEVTVGSGFFAPTLFDYYDAFNLYPAAGFAIEVVRSPKAGMFTCHGGGYIASGAVGKEKQPVPYLPQGAKLTDNEGAGEVQTPIVYDGPDSVELGDPVFMRHSKAGELCEHFNELLLVRNGQVIDSVTTYRGDGYAFL